MLYRIALCAAIAAGSADADIVVDLPIVGALVAAVVEAPVTILAEGQADPHGLTLRPSQARALQDADLIVHLGSGMTPAVERAIADAGAPVVSLADLGGFALPDDDGHDDHAEADDHDHAGGDPHVWLDFTHLDKWTTGIANAATNAGLTVHEESQIDAASMEAALQAAIPSSMPNVLVTHDVWSRLTDLLGIAPFAIIADGHAAAPGARHLAALRDRIEAGAVDCILAAPTDALTQAEGLVDDYDLPIVMADPQGDASATGMDRYRSVFAGFAAALSECQANAM